MNKDYPNDEFLLPSVPSITKIKGPYKEYKHSGNPWKNYRDDESCPRNKSTRRDKSRRNEFSRDEALVNSLDGSNARQEARKLGAPTAGKAKQKSASSESPASCLKTTCSKKKGGAKKKVLFTETSCSPSSAECYDCWAGIAAARHRGNDYDSVYDYDCDAYPSNSSSQRGERRGRSRAVSSSSATLYAETTSSVSAPSSACESTANSRELDARLARMTREAGSRRWTLPTDAEPFRRTIVHQGDGGWRNEQRNVRSAECSHVAKLEAAMPMSKSHSTRESRRSSRRLSSTRCTRGSPRLDEAPGSEEGRALEKDLERMALTSSTCCSGPTLPRIVKSRDVFKRVAIRRMLAYPPQGQSGEPLTLLKKWSNIDCHVQGNSQKGFRYKVYYLQEFESSAWYPDERTGSPFHVDDEVCSTDYG